MTKHKKDSEAKRKARIAKYEASLKPMSVAELIRRTKKSEEDIKAGRVTSSEDLEKEFAKW